MLKTGVGITISAKIAKRGVKTAEEAEEITKASAKALEISDSAKNGEWTKVFESGYKPKDMIENKSFLDKFRKDTKIPDH